MREQDKAIPHIRPIPRKKLGPYQCNFLYHWSRALGEALFYQESFARGLTFFYSGDKKIPVSELSPDTFPEDIKSRTDLKVLGSEAYGDKHSLSYVLFGSEGLLVLAFLSGISDSFFILEVRVSARTHEVSVTETEKLLDSFSVWEPDQAKCSYVAFTHWGSNGLSTSLRSFQRFPAWAEIEENYVPSCRDSLQRLLQLGPTIEEGKLAVLWGSPGTGKTWFLRSLIQELEKTFSPYYILDAERFFQEPAYIMQLLLTELPGDSRKRLFIFEDADEFLTQNAKASVGQSFSRLLNLTSGLIGQANPVLLLFTSNEPFEKLHPAITRPGRCFAQVEFPLFSPDQAQAWIRERTGDQEASFQEPVSLATLHGHLTQKPEQIVSISARKKLGFG